MNFIFFFRLVTHRAHQTPTWPQLAFRHLFYRGAKACIMV